jgi:hypothetical protein
LLPLGETYIPLASSQRRLSNAVWEASALQGTAASVELQQIQHRAPNAKKMKNDSHLQALLGFLTNHVLYRLVN